MLKTLEEALTKSDAELFAELGRRAYVIDGKIYQKKSTHDDPEDEQNGRSVFEAAKAQLKTEICDEWKACERISKYGDEASLGAALMSYAFSGGYLAGLPPVIVVVLVVRIGIKKFCDCPT